MLHLSFSSMQILKIIAIITLIYCLRQVEISSVSILILAFDGIKWASMEFAIVKHLKGKLLVLLSKARKLCVKYCTFYFHVKNNAPILQTWPRGYL